jgi:hypothetical protein
MNQEQSGSRKIGKHILAYWHCDPAEAECEIKMWRDGALLIAARMTRQGRKPTAILPFDLRLEDEPVTLCGSFELAFNHGGTPHSLALDLDEYGAGMKRYHLWPAHPDPVPPDPPEPTPQPEPLAVDADVAAARIEEDMDADLFPYLYLRPWTGAGKQELEDNFIAYLPAPHGLYERLVKAKAKGRTAMEQTAVEFVEEHIPEARAGLARLPHWLHRFPACYDALRDLRPHDAHALRREVETHLECSWTALREHVHGKEFAPAMDLCWQGVMALNILLGDRRRQLNAIIKTIVLGHLLSRMLLLGEEGSDGELALPLHCHDYWTPSRIADGLAATPILPDTLFPLPKPKDAQAANEDQDKAAIYAIGDLELVRQRLKSYALGEVSRIENVMRGESVETTRRQLSRTSVSTSERTTADASSENDWSGTSSHRHDKSTRSLSLDLAIDNTTTYGPPADLTATETVKIGPNADKSPQQEAVEKAAGHARAVTTRSVARLARRVESERASTTLDEREDTVVARLDGSGNERNVRGIYRWVDKIYEAYVVNYGHRLMLEFTLAQPAAGFVHDQQLLCGRSLLRPQPPGLSSYTDISRTPDTKHYYAALIAAYDAFDAALPPAGSKTLSISARVSTAGSIQEVAIPDGYEAAEATVSANWPGQGQGQAPDLFGLVGTHPFALSAKDRAQGGGGHQAVLKLSGETGTLPFSIALAPRPSALDATGAQPLPPACVASVDIKLTPTLAAIREWQFGFYRAIQQAYQSRLREWLEAVGAGQGGAGINPLAGRQAVQQTLGRRMRQVLWQHAVDTAGASPQDRARYEQFFNQAFEWKEMCYSLGEGWGAGELAAADSPLSAFIEADTVRVLLPVQPSGEQCIPYFMKSGMLWDGDRRLVPAMAEAVDLVGDLKQCHGRHHEPVRSRCWQFRVPTTMTVIQQSEELPTF